MCGGNAAARFPPGPARRALDINGAIDPITAEFLVRSIDRAEADKAEFLLIRLNTPGGFASSMEEIISRMLASKVPVVVYVAPSGAKAASAGFFILLAADVAAMAPGTNTGAAHPLMAIGGFPIEGGEAGKTLTEKITSNAKAFLRSIASKRNRNVEEAGKGVVESKSFTDGEALEKHLIDLVARDEAELLRRLDGYKVRMFSGQEGRLKTAGRTDHDYLMTTRERFLSTISQPNLALLLGVAGLILLYFEFTHPGFVAPGVIGGICLLLSILGFSFLPINYVGVLLILLAIGLFVAEVKIQGFGILGFGGVVAMVIGTLILIDTPDPAMRIGLGDGDRRRPAFCRYLPHTARGAPEVHDPESCDRGRGHDRPRRRRRQRGSQKRSCQGPWGVLGCPLRRAHQEQAGPSG